jgi:putative peptidoglycan lipid II flippase
VDFSAHAQAFPKMSSGEPAVGSEVGEQSEQGRRESGRIARAFSVLSSATMLSRVLGLVRDVVTASLFGAGGALDAFLVAFRLPNMLRSLFAEGSLTVAFVPVFVELEESEGAERANRFGRVALTLLAIILPIVVAVGVGAAPWIVRLVAMGFAESSDKYALTVELTRIVFPYIGLVSITAFLGGILNARGVFLYPALAPVALNVCIIIAALALAGVVEPAVASLAFGVLIGGCCQWALQIRPLRKTGFRFRFDFNFSDPALKKVFLLMGPAVFGVAVYQLNLVVSTFLASWLPDGSISYLYYAERLFQLPLGVFAVSVGVASLPSLSRLAAREDWTEFSDTLRAACRLLWFVIIPASVGLLLLAEPVVALLFQRGDFTAVDTVNTAAALRFYALALVPVATTRIIAQGFYAMKDTKTPVKGAAWALGVNLVASLIFMWPMKHAGLALATAISAGVNTLYLAHQYRKQTGSWPFSGLRSALTRIFVSAVVMGAGVVVGLFVAPEAASGGMGFWGLFGFVGFSVVGGAGVYAVVGRLAGLDDLSVIVRRVKGG